MFTKAQFHMHIFQTIISTKQLNKNKLGSIGKWKMHVKGYNKYNYTSNSYPKFFCYVGKETKINYSKG